ncbi:MAG: zinc ribbon domain-containing protein [Phycisphaerales bacterium]|nr:zinc ribbon domain-containing protein [Phycisphaerales bacterium]
MPTYEYRCRSCGHEMELFQSMSDAPKRKCPDCGKNTLERLIGTGAAIVFKGSGFYQTDYRSESYKKAAEAESKPAETKTDKVADKAVDKPAKTEKAAESPKHAEKAASKPAIRVPAAPPIKPAKAAKRRSR